MDTTALVSVVLCARNGAAFIGEQLKSLEQQTYPSLEFICADNSSTDGTADILRAWCEDKLNRKFISCTAPGLNKTFFTAMQYATGEFIIFCDQDDVWLPNKIEALVNFHLGTPVGFNGVLLV